jgi:hypothetical protein
MVQRKHVGLIIHRLRIQVGVLLLLEWYTLKELNYNF